MVDYLHRSLDQTRQNEHTLAEQNQQLAAYRATLETQVADRTRAAEAARQRAEAAQHALEDEIWLSKGLLPLNQALSGEQEPGLLATRAIQIVCDTLQASVGVAYLAQSDGLDVIATYAVLHGDGKPGHLRLGEGLAGQAALERQPVIVRDIAPAHLSLTSGLGDALPSAVVAWPMTYGDTLIGALEVGFFGAMPERVPAFLERAAELIAVALHTAQSRQRINALLAETR
jgi:signal transduction protein with GAF and PtsI domain